MRIVSLLPSATEILFSLGLDHEIVGVSHECDFPPQARTKPVVIHSRLPLDAPPVEIDRLVREYASRGESLYAVDTDILEALQPDLIITQDLCHVCAASPEDLATVLGGFHHRPDVLCLNPQDLGDVWRDILLVGEATSRGPQAEALLGEIGERLGKLEEQLDDLAPRPRVAFLEWLEPIYVGGHWIPEMIRSAGGEDVLGTALTPSFRIHLQEVVEAAPDILLVAPCGYTAEQSRKEYLSIELPEQWNVMPAVRNSRVYALNANSYFSRPGPRLVTGIEILAKVLQPSVSVSLQAELAILPIPSARAATRAAFV
jgi:iron complex transport system substrate-binding protein